MVGWSTKLSELVVDVQVQPNYRGGQGWRGLVVKATALSVNPEGTM
jgi:hypothetical protein